MSDFFFYLTAFFLVADIIFLAWANQKPDMPVTAAQYLAILLLILAAVSLVTGRLVGAL